jgi:hypothetical protein
MAPTIRIDESVYTWLQQQARPFEDTPNSVLRRIAKLDDVIAAPNTATRKNTATHSRQEKTPQSAYREPILEILLEHGGQISRTEGLKELERKLANQLTPHDQKAIKSGDVRWQKTAEWEVRKMRIANLIRPVHETPRGVWALTEKGAALAHEV